MNLLSLFVFFFFFNDPAPPEIYPLPLHDALPISGGRRPAVPRLGPAAPVPRAVPVGDGGAPPPLRPGRHARRRRRVPGPGAHRRPGHARSEEHTSELQSQSNLVCRLLLEKKKTDS